MDLNHNVFSKDGNVYIRVTAKDRPIRITSEDQLVNLPTMEPINNTDDSNDDRRVLRSKQTARDRKKQNGKDPTTASGSTDAQAKTK